MSKPFEKTRYEFIPGSVAEKGKLRPIRAVSMARRARKKLMQLFGITSGRGWVRLRKRLERERKAA